MNKSNGSVTFVVLSINIFFVLIITLLIHIVSLTKHVTIKYAQMHRNDCRFNVLIEIARQYVTHHKNKNKNIQEGTIFDDVLLLEGVDRYKGMIHLIRSKNEYEATITIYVNDSKKTLQKIL